MKGHEKNVSFYRNKMWEIIDVGASKGMEGFMGYIEKYKEWINNPNIDEDVLKQQFQEKFQQALNLD